MREDRGVARCRAKLFEYTVDAGSDLLCRLSRGDAVSPQRPTGALAADLERRTALVGAVVPLHQLVALYRHVGEAGQAASLRGALQRARKDEGEAPRPERDPDSFRVLPASFGQWDVGSTGVLTGAAPLGLAVSDENDLGWPGGQSVSRRRLVPTPEPW